VLQRARLKNKPAGKVFAPSLRDASCGGKTSTSVISVSYEYIAIIYSIDRGLRGLGRVTYGLKVAFYQDESVPCAVGAVVIGSRDDTIVVDLGNNRVGGAGIVDCRGLSICANETVLHVRAVGIASSNHAFVVDRADDRARLPWDIDLGVLSGGVCETMENTGAVLVAADDGSDLVDTCRGGHDRIRKRKTRESTVYVFEAVRGRTHTGRNVSTDDVVVVIYAEAACHRGSWIEDCGHDSTLQYEGALGTGAGIIGADDRIVVIDSVNRRVIGFDFDFVECT